MEQVIDDKSQDTAIASLKKLKVTRTKLTEAPFNGAVERWEYEDGKEPDYHTRLKYGHRGQAFSTAEEAMEAYTASRKRREMEQAARAEVQPGQAAAGAGVAKKHKAHHPGAADQHTQRQQRQQQQQQKQQRQQHQQHHQQQQRHQHRQQLHRIQQYREPQQPQHAGSRYQQQESGHTKTAVVLTPAPAACAPQQQQRQQSTGSRSETKALLPAPAANTILQQQQPLISRDGVSNATAAERPQATAQDRAPAARVTTETPPSSTEAAAAAAMTAGSKVAALAAPAARMPAATALGYAGQQVKLIEVFNPELAGHVLTLGPSLGSGMYAVVHQSKAMPTAGAVTASSGRQFAVKVFNSSIGIPGSIEYRRTNSPEGQAQLRRFADTEIKVHRLLLGQKGVARMHAIGELQCTPVAAAAASGAISKPGTVSNNSGREGSSSSSEVQRVRCIVLERLVPLTAAVDRHYPLPVDKLRTMTNTVVGVLELMHSGRLQLDGQHYVVVHRDLGLGNMLLGPNSVFVTDFGSAALVPVGPISSNSSSSNGAAAEIALKTIIGTPLYMAPEVGELYERAAAAAAAAAAELRPVPADDAPAASYDSSADMWSLGVMVMFMFGGGPVRMAEHTRVELGMKRHEHMEQLVTRFVNGEQLIGPMTAADVDKQQYIDIREFVGCCCGVNGKKRMTAAEMMDPKTQPSFLQGMQPKQ